MNMFNCIRILLYTNLLLNDMWGHFFNFSVTFSSSSVGLFYVGYKLFSSYAINVQTERQAPFFLLTVTRNSA